MDRCAPYNKNRRLLALTSIAGAVMCQMELYQKEKLKKGRKRSFWVRPFLELRKQRGDFYVAIPEMISLDPSYFFETFRMTPALFEDLLSKVGPIIQKEEHFVRESIPAAERLYATLAFLASGDQQKSIAKDYRLGRSTVCKIIHETTQAIYTALKPTYLKFPEQEDWIRIAHGYENRWNFPHCVGAVDGKHFAIPRPPNSSSEYFNYKKFYSVVMLATCDADYNFVYVSVGSSGSESDAGIFSRSNLGQKLRAQTLTLPEPDCLSGTPLKLPYCLVGDEAFPLMKNLMRPYARVNLDDATRIFNYRLSRARNTIENAFGILVCRWPVLYGILQMLPEYATMTILACVSLHNYVRQNPQSASFYVPAGFVDTENTATGVMTPGSWRHFVQQDTPLQRTSSNNYTRDASQIRESFKMYFNTFNALPWQQERAWHS